MGPLFKLVVGKLVVGKLVVGLFDLMVRGMCGQRTLFRRDGTQSSGLLLLPAELSCQPCGMFGLHVLL